VLAESFTTIEWLDHIYSKDLLKGVPGMVKRTRQLQRLPCAGLPESVALAHLTESSNCYVRGLFRATITLARAAVEAALRVGAEKVLRTDLREVDLKKVIDCCGKVVKSDGKRLLTPEGIERAHLVRKDANAILHKQSTTDGRKALRVFEAARMVLKEVSPTT
jgi:hypothetical protein